MGGVCNTSGSSVGVCVYVMLKTLSFFPDNEEGYQGMLTKAGMLMAVGML